MGRWALIRWVLFYLHVDPGVSLLSFGWGLRGNYLMEGRRGFSREVSRRARLWMFDVHCRLLPQRPLGDFGRGASGVASSRAITSWSLADLSYRPSAGHMRWSNLNVRFRSVEVGLRAVSRDWRWSEDCEGPGRDDLAASRQGVLPGFYGGGGPRSKVIKGARF